jgi:hypothetical protein
MEKIITIYFYEVTSRIVPGLVVLVFYFNEKVENAFCDYYHLNYIVIAGVLLASWLIGIVLDGITWGLYKVIAMHRFRNAKSKTIWFSKPKPNPNIKNTDINLRLQAIKEHAEEVMCRVLFLISVLSWCKSPVGHLENTWHWYYSVSGIVAFGALWYIGFVNSRGGLKPTKPHSQPPKPTA